MHRITCAVLVVAIGLVAGVGCGRDAPGADAVASSDREAQAGEPPPTEDDERPVPTYDGNPGDLLTLSNQGTTDTILGYESYEQMRDFSDTVVTATLTGVSVEDAKPDPVLSGTLLATFDVTDVIGGRNDPQPTERGVEVVVSLDADDDLTRTVLARLEPLVGHAEYLLFLNRAVPGPEGEVRYVPTLSSGPPGLLAFWPGDGRLSPVQGQNDLAADAIERGEELTGTSDVPPVLGEPDFEGPPPIGLTSAELVDTFARPVGTVETEEPIGWDLYQDVLEEALGE